MNRFQCLLAAGLLLLCDHVAAQELSAANLDRLKASTVYIRHEQAGGLSMGSGFLFKKSGNTGFILTCEHVVRGAAATDVVFRSGTADEKKLRGTVVATDADRDLACLRVTDEALPAPLELGTKTEVRETETVFGAGFPFGEMLATSERCPDISVTRAAVSSIRRGDRGEVVTVQLSGDLNAGNSGGPVVDVKGRVVGVTAAKIRGTQTAFAIPPEELKGFLKGRVKGASFDVVSADDKAVKLQVTVSLIDPLGTIKSVSWAWIRDDQLKGVLDSGGKDGTFKLGNPAMRIVTLKVDPTAGIASGTVDFKRGATDAATWRIIFQCGGVTADQVTTWTQEGEHKITFKTGTATAPPKPADEPVAPVAGKELEAPEQLDEVARLPLHGVVPDMFLSSDGAWLYVLDAADGKVLKLDAASLAVAGELDIGDEAIAMCLNTRGDALYVASTLNAGSKVDRNGRGRVTEIAVPALTIRRTRDFKGDPQDVEATNGGLVAVSIVFQGTGGVLVDLSGKRGESELRLLEGSFLRLHPDQSRLYAGDIESIPPDFRCVRLDAEGGSGGYPEWDSPYHGDYPLGGDLVITPDGRFLLAATGTVLRLGRSKETDLQYVGRTDPWLAAAVAPDIASAFYSTRDAFIKQVRLGSFELQKTLKITEVALKLALGAEKRRLYAFVVPSATAIAQRPWSRNYGCGDLVAWSLEKR